MASARPVAPGFFPLDEELALLPGSLTPRVHEALVRLSTHIPSFAKAAAELAWFTQVDIHRDTARRVTEAAGATAVMLQTAAAAHILQTHPVPPSGPERLVLSVDGAMIPLVHGEWTEVRTLAVGEVTQRSPTTAGARVHTTNLSYFSRRTDSTTFTDQALAELHRRGIETAKQVAAVVDGATWCQQFIDLHAPDAVRILDFAHAAEYVTAIGQTVGPEGTLLETDDLARLRHALKHMGPRSVLAELRAVVAAHADMPQLATQLAYLEKREAQLQYPQFQRDGWPIGSGLVESANKLVVEDRLKGAGMHWADPNVNPMLALRNAICNDRWDEVWSGIEAEQGRQSAERRRTRRAQRGRSGRPGPPPAPPVATLEGVALTPPPALEPPAKPPHPWKRPWSIRRQRDLAGAT